MFFVRDKGQMCNNLLQFAHVYAWARENHRRCMSMRFAYKYPYFYISSTPHHNWFCYLAGKYAARLRLIPVVSYNSFDEDTAAKERQLLQARHAVVEGWGVRHFDLFLKYLPDICRLFAFRPDICRHIHTYMQEQSAGESCINIGIHVRRGDYRTWCNGKFFFTDDEFIAYLHRTLQQLAPRRCCIYVCGNAAVNQNLFRSRLASRPGVSLHFPQGNPGEDLCLLSQCDYLLGPLSSFTLVASMYGKARLYWMYSHDTAATPIDFQPFAVRLPQLDTLWLDVYHGTVI